LLRYIAHCPQPDALKYRAPFGTGTWVALTGVVFFGVIVFGAQLIGWWNPKITGNPEDIKGWMTLGSISETYHIPISEIKKELKLPVDATAETEIRFFEKTVPNFEMDIIRNFVASRIGKAKLDNQAGSVPVTTETKITTPTLAIKEPKTNTELKEKISVVSQTNPGPEKEMRDPDEIRGTMTLVEVSKGWKIPLAALLEKLGVPKDVDTKVPIHDLESQGVNGMKVREAVKAIFKDAMRVTDS
jgi:hypothetical protein